MESKYTDETLTLINLRFCSTHYGLSDFDITLANEYVELIEKSRSKTIPKSGDRIRYTNEYGEYFYRGHIESIKENVAIICEKPYVPFIEKNEKNNGISCSTSGGPWCSVPLSGLRYVGVEEKTFCDWGHCGCCANGAIEFVAEVSVWEYQKKPLEGILHTTRNPIVAKW